MEKKFEAEIFAIDTKEGTVSLDIRPEDIDTWVRFWQTKSYIQITINAELKQKD